MTDTASTVIDDGGTEWTYFTWPEQKPVPNAEGSIRCEVNADGEIELIPLDALAAYFLHHFGHGAVRAAWSLVADYPNKKHHLKKLVLRHEPRPLLSGDGDPYYTGVPLSAAEQKACRALIDEMRDGKPKRKKVAKKSKRA